MKNFWKQLDKPIKVLSPMAGYTDSAFRILCRELGADVVVTELISADAIYHTAKNWYLSSPAPGAEEHTRPWGGEWHYSTGGTEESKNKCVSPENKIPHCVVAVGRRLPLIAGRCIQAHALCV